MILITMSDKNQGLYEMEKNKKQKRKFKSYIAVCQQINLLFSYMQIKFMLFDWSRRLMEIRLSKRSFLAPEERSIGFVR